MDISKIESGKMELSSINFDFNKMFNTVESVISLRMQEKHQNFTVDIDDKIPSLLYGDDQRLAQVITNLLPNAMKFTPENGNISFSAKLVNLTEDKCSIEMCVTDSGIGMTQEEQGRIFTMFQQAEAGTSRKFGGSGLGLVISKRILEMMDGNIWVQSEKGKGSKFFFTVNIRVPESDASSDSDKTTSNSGRPDGDKTQNDFSDKVILLADDIDINLEIIITLLEPTGVQIDTAKSGKEALDLFAANPTRYDMILMDVQMPGIDGLQATKMIRAMDIPNASTVPIIAMTANVFREDIEKCFASGMDGHLGKPIVMDDVIAVLNKYLS